MATLEETLAVQTAHDGPEVAQFVHRGHDNVGGVSHQVDFLAPLHEIRL